MCISSRLIANYLYVFSLRIESIFIKTNIYHKSELVYISHAKGSLHFSKHNFYFSWSSFYTCHPRFMQPLASKVSRINSLYREDENRAADKRIHHSPE